MLRKMFRKKYGKKINVEKNVWKKFKKQICLEKQIFKEKIFWKKYL